MPPIIVLGQSASNAPAIEFYREELHPIAACVIHLNTQQFKTSDDLLGQLYPLIGLDVMFLDAGSAPVFRMFEDACKKIVAREITRYDAALIKEYAVTQGFYIIEFGEDGRLEPDVVVAAQRFLDFLAANPDFWPPRLTNATNI